MDPLSDVLRAVRLTGSYFYMVEGSPGWAVGTVAARELAPRILPEAEHLVPYHILSQGVCWGGLRGEPRVQMQPGDVLIFPHGDAHVMSGQPAESREPTYSVSAPEQYPSTVRLGAGRLETILMCGFLGCDSGPFNPILSALPKRERRWTSSRRSLALAPTTPRCSRSGAMLHQRISLRASAHWNESDSTF